MATKLRAPTVKFEVPTYSSRGRKKPKKPMRILIMMCSLTFLPCDTTQFDLLVRTTVDIIICDLHRTEALNITRSKHQ